MPPTRPPSSTSACSACTANCTVRSPGRVGRSRSARPTPAVEPPGRSNPRRAGGADRMGTCLVPTIAPMSRRAAQLDAIAVELYALPPEEFTAARNARAAASDRALAARVKTAAASRPPRRGPSICSPGTASSPKRSSSRRAARSAGRSRRRRARPPQPPAPRTRHRAGDAGRRPRGRARRRGEPGRPRRRREDDQCGGDGCRSRRRGHDRATRARPWRRAGSTRSTSRTRWAAALPGVPDAPPPTRDDLAERRARKEAERARARGRTAPSGEAERDLARIDAKLAKARERADHLRERIDELRAELAARSKPTRHTRRRRGRSASTAGARRGAHPSSVRRRTTKADAARAGPRRAEHSMTCDIAGTALSRLPRSTRGSRRRDGHR